MGRHPGHGLLWDFFEVENDQETIVVVGSDRVRQDMETRPKVAQRLLLAHQMLRRSQTVRCAWKLRASYLDPRLQGVYTPKAWKEVAILSGEVKGIWHGRQHPYLINPAERTGDLQHNRVAPRVRE